MMTHHILVRPSMRIWFFYCCSGFRYVSLEVCQLHQEYLYIHRKFWSAMIPWRKQLRWVWDWNVKPNYIKCSGNDGKATQKHKFLQETIHIEVIISSCFFWKLPYPSSVWNHWETMSDSFFETSGWVPATSKILGLKSSKSSKSSKSRFWGGPGL